MTPFRFSNDDATQLSSRILGLLLVFIRPASAVAQEQPATALGGPLHLETSDAACTPGTVRNPRSHRCLAVCPDGRLEVVHGRCCWPGQDIGESTQECVGVVAHCPVGTRPNPGDAEECLRLCPGGRIEVDSGHCCWPGQRWREDAQKCEGSARCPRATVADPRDPADCLRRCSGDRLEVAPGHCCRPGETWRDDVQQCIGAASCSVGTMANPRNVAECLKTCPGDRVEVSPGHCCWPGQSWNIDMGECEGRALACTAHMQLSPAAACVPLDRACETSLDCSDDSVCLAGRCEPGRRFRRFEVFAEGAPVVLGSWSVSDSSYSLASGNFSLRGAAGLALRASWSIHPRWSAGGYLGYLRAANGQIDVDQGRNPEMLPVSMSFRMVRLGGLVNYRWSRRHGLVYGVGLEAGFVVGTASQGDTPFGVEVAPEFFLDVPLGFGTARSYLTLSLAIRAGSMDHSPPGYESAIERWTYVMPLLRLGFGVGH